MLPLKDNVPTRTFPFVTVGLIASVTALVGGPVIRAVLTTLAVAAELLTPAPLVLEAAGSR